MFRTTQFVIALSIVLVGCGSSDVSSDEDAQRAYEGLDDSIDKAITLGFQGFNAATSANIAPQTANGAKTGTITISGQVDQGASTNKTMNLIEELKDYSDDGEITYNTNETLPVLSMKLSKIPTGTLEGSLNGRFTMAGALEGDVTLSLTFTGELQPSPVDENEVERKPGTTHITGTAASGDGRYNVDLTR
ncbi:MULTISPECIES: hypothetical protein [Sorangium]|uniref:Uncharacterized protein n=1 Tax=Sorangium cellulosum (strain So ce56) TaxID=448385 RepID=A9EP64_SORC5|nr:hypothetical protein [Sorangium cellulosum]CAN90943.1 hypothetical protein predicted by Glimmer/Critica [Sorangium cellulosum So ce56]